jgi:hypothetical protein
LAGNNDVAVIEPSAVERAQQHEHSALAVHAQRQIERGLSRSTHLRWDFAPLRQLVVVASRTDSSGGDVVEEPPLQPSQPDQLFIRCGDALPMVARVLEQQHLSTGEGLPERVENSLR